METAVQDDLHVAVFDDASCVFHHLFLGRVDDFGVHAAYKGESLEFGVQCERTFPLYALRLLNTAC